jgi:ABC-2 type transport system permease protein
MRRILALARKETYHILRDPRSLAVAVVMPVAMVILYGYAIDMELRDLPVGFLDEDQSPASRDLIARLTSSQFILDAGRLASRDAIEPGFRQGRFRAAMVIPRGFAESLVREPVTRVQVLIDGADATSAAAVDNYLRAAILLFNADLAAGSAVLHSASIEPRVRVLFNPELVSANFVVPGLVAVVLVMIGALLTSIAITREKETGTMEQVLTTPIAPRQLVIGKVLPYLLIASADAAFVLLVGRFVFGVPMNGSWEVLAGYSLVYLLIALALGLLISAVATTQRVAMIMALMATLLPTLLLSGFIFPRASMPTVLQWVGQVVPATYYLEVIRGIMLKGRAWFPFEGGIMAGMALFLLLMAVKRFGTTME